VRGVEDDSSHRLTVPEKSVTVNSVTTEMGHGTLAIKADIEGVDRSLIIDTGSDVSILKPGISKANIRDTTLGPYEVTGETLEVKVRPIVSLGLGRRKFDHTFLVCPLPTEAAGLLGTDFIEGRSAHIYFEDGKRDTTTKRRTRPDHRVTTHDVKSPLHLHPTFLLRKSERNSLLLLLLLLQFSFAPFRLIISFVYPLFTPTVRKTLPQGKVCKKKHKSQSVISNQER